MTDQTFLGFDSPDEALAWLKRLEDVRSRLYYALFELGVGDRFHAFLEWNGVMGEHIKIAEDLVKAGVDPGEHNAHSGGSSIPDYRIKYLVEKLNCIFDGAVEVRAAENVT